MQREFMYSDLNNLSLLHEYKETATYSIIGKCAVIIYLPVAQEVLWDWMLGTTYIQTNKTQNAVYECYNSGAHQRESSVQSFYVSHTFLVCNPNEQCGHLTQYVLTQITLYMSLSSRIKTRMQQLMQRTAKAHKPVQRKVSLIHARCV
jgi:hypothetical protein